MAKKTINDILHSVIWEYHDGENRCEYCHIWEGTAGKPHDDDCIYGQLLKIVERGLEETTFLNTLKAIQKILDGVEQNKPVDTWRDACLVSEIVNNILLYQKVKNENV